jgi:hypothetical protein
LIYEKTRGQKPRKTVSLRIVKMYDRNVNDFTNFYYAFVGP